MLRLGDGVLLAGRWCATALMDPGVEVSSEQHKAGKAVPTNLYRLCDSQ